MKPATCIAVLCVLAALLASAAANSPAPAPTPAPAVLPAVVTNTGSINVELPFAALSTSCFASGSKTAAAGTVTATLALVNGTRAWPASLTLAAYTASEWTRVAADPLMVKLGAIAHRTAAPAAAQLTFAPLNVVNKDAATQSWTIVVLAPSGVNLPPFQYSLTFTQNATAAAASPAQCLAPVEAAADAGAHHSSSKLSLALVGAFGGVVWLSTVFLVVKNTCSQQFFSFANFMATIPSKDGSSSSSSDSHDAVATDEEAGPSSHAAPTSTSGKRKLRLDPKRKQLEDLRLATDAVATITSFRAMPPRFAASLGTFVIVVVSGVWISLLLATMEVENWPSWVGAGITVVLIVAVSAWCYVRSKMGATNNQEMVEQLQREFAYAVERSRAEMAEETQMETAQH